MSNETPTLAICLLAALADGERTPAEQEQLTRIAIGQGGDPAALQSEIQRGELTLAESARRLTTPESRRMAYELAVAMVYADGLANERERAFLTELQRELGL